MKSTEKDKIAWVQQAYKYHHSGQYEEAIFACNQALQIDKTFARAHFGRALAFYKLNKTKHALLALKETIKYNRNHIRACLLAGEICHQRGLYKRALQFYNQALLIDPLDKDALAGKEKATIHQAEQDKQKQEADEKARLLEAKLNESILNGDKYYDEGNYQEAIDAYKDACQLSPNNRDVLRKMAKTYIKLEQFVEANAIYGILRPAQVMGITKPYSWGFKEREQADFYQW